MNIDISIYEVVDRRMQGIFRDIYECTLHVICRPYIWLFESGITKKTYCVDMIEQFLLIVVVLLKSGLQQRNHVYYLI